MVAQYTGLYNTEGKEIELGEKFAMRMYEGEKTLEQIEDEENGIIDDFGLIALDNTAGEMIWANCESFSEDPSMFHIAQVDGIYYLCLNQFFAVHTEEDDSLLLLEEKPVKSIYPKYRDDEKLPVLCCANEPFHVKVIKSNYGRVELESVDKNLHAHWELLSERTVADRYKLVTDSHFH